MFVGSGRYRDDDSVVVGPVTRHNISRYAVAGASPIDVIKYRAIDVGGLHHVLSGTAPQWHIRG